MGGMAQFLSHAAWQGGCGSVRPVCGQKNSLLTCGRKRFSADSIAIAGTPGGIVEALCPSGQRYDKSGFVQAVLNYEAEKRPAAEGRCSHCMLEEFKRAGCGLAVATN